MIKLLIFFVFISCDKKILNDPIAEKSADTKNKNPLPEITEQMHPRQPTQWETEILLMTNKDKINLDVSSCSEKLKNPKYEMIQKDNMGETIDQLKKEIKSDLLNSHWCFYLLSSHLDKQMEDSQTVLQEKALLFQKQTSRLFFLAKALEQITKPAASTYSNHIKQRYMSISKNIFGRKLDSMQEVLNPTKG